MNFQLIAVACFCVFQRKHECSHLGEKNNRGESSILTFCNIKIRKPFELIHEIQCLSERHFYNAGHVLHNMSLKCWACVEASMCDCKTAKVCKNGKMRNLDILSFGGLFKPSKPQEVPIVK